jgi:hypothetical protein
MIRIKPSLKDALRKGKVIKKRANVIANQNAPQRFATLHIVWVQTNGVPFDTTGFRARLIRRGRVVATAAFDRFGVARFNTIDALTRVSFTLQAIDRNGIVFRTRRIPANIEVFAIIG